MNKRSYGNQHLKFLLIAIIILIALDRLFPMPLPQSEDIQPAVNTQQKVQEFSRGPIAVPDHDPVNEAARGEKTKKLRLARLEPEMKVTKSDELFKTKTSQEIKKEMPAWKRNAVPTAFRAGQPKVIIVIDDLGIGRNYSREVIALPPPLTLAFLPYADGVDKMAEKARTAGHELMVHMPMEPMNSALDIGDIFIDTRQTPEEFTAMLGKGLAAFNGYVGVNNHMGSRLTQNKQAMQDVMAELKERGLLFLDSRTIASSVAAKTAASYGLPYAQRDVFLDHDPSLEAVRHALQRTEEIAREYGQAIAIGHPKPDTIKALKEWLPTLKDKGIALVPISAAVITKPAVASAAPPESQAQQHQ